MASKIPHIYMDACCFIDAAKHRLGMLPSDRKDDFWHVGRYLKAAEEKAVRIFTSTVSVAECRHAGGECPVDVRYYFDSILQSGQIVTLVDCSVFVAERARDLCIEHSLSLRSADAIHVATALEMKCLEFLTTDNKGPIKNNKIISKIGMHVLKPAKTRYLPSKYRQAEMLDMVAPINPSAEPFIGN